MLLNVFRVRTRDESLSKAVQAALLDSLFASKASLIIGTVLGCSWAGLAAYTTRSPALITCSILLSLAGASRILSFGMFKPGAATGSGLRWEIIYHLGAWFWAGILGALSFLVLIVSDDLSLHVLAGTLTTGWAAGATGRNMGRPLVAIGQLVLCAAPLSLALVVHPSIANILLAVANLLFIIVMIDITLQTYKTVLDAFTDRQEKLHLANVYERLSKTDPLTGLDNRITLNTNLKALLEASDQMVAVVWLDLDRFKQINDTLGHAAGDVVLHTVSARLRQLAASEGMVARFGGDEFIVVQPVVDAAAAVAFAERVRRVLSVPDENKGIVIDISASVGVSMSTTGMTSADDLLRHADVALYEAKSRGRNCVVVFDPEMEQRLLKNKQIEDDLKRAIPNGELELFFQPIINLETGRVQSCEALLRWHHPVHGSIPPGLFIPIAEQSGQIGVLTDWVLDRACMTASTWPEEVSVGVNISPALLKSRELPLSIYETLLRSGLPARRLDLEITETALVEDNANIKVVLDGFHKLGLKLSLDDFGTGYSSLSYLCRYRFDVIKIDRSFTADVHRSSEARAVVQAVSSLAKSLNLSVVAEGIETADQLEYIQNQGCAAGQGYYFARPMPAAKIIRFLTGGAEELEDQAAQARASGGR